MKKTKADTTYVVESHRPEPKNGKINQKVYVPMAELIHQSETRLPDRFRYKPVERPATCGAMEQLKKTVPRGPMLATRARKGKTRRELEGERLRKERQQRESEAFKRPTFQARKYCFATIP